MRSKIYKLIIFSTTFIFFSQHINAFEIVGKALKCDAKKFPTRGYPFFFYFEDKNKFHSYYILDKEIRYHDFNYRQINANIYDLSHIGFININELILTHSKYNTKCSCTLLDTNKEISLKLQSYINNGK